LGLPFAEINGDEFILSHEFITRFGRNAQRNLMTLTKDQISTWFRGEDLRNTTSSGAPVQIMIDEDRNVIGRGKPAADRLRNLLPKRALIPDLI